MQDEIQKGNQQQSTLWAVLYLIKVSLSHDETEVRPPP